VGVRSAAIDLRRRIGMFLARAKPAIDALLRAYHVPNVLN
jgi:hypothetical protein